MESETAYMYTVHIAKIMTWTRINYWYFHYSEEIFATCKNLSICMHRGSGNPHYVALVETKSMKCTKGSWTIYKMRIRCQQKCTTCTICQNVILSQDIAYMHVLNIHATVLWHNVMYSIYSTCSHAYSPKDNGSLHFDLCSSTYIYKPHSYVASFSDKWMPIYHRDRWECMPLFMQSWKVCSWEDTALSSSLDPMTSHGCVFTITVIHIATHVYCKYLDMIQLQLHVHVGKGFRW